MSIPTQALKRITAVSDMHSDPPLQLRRTVVYKLFRTLSTAFSICSTRPDNLPDLSTPHCQTKHFLNRQAKNTYRAAFQYLHTSIPAPPTLMNFACCSF